MLASAVGASPREALTLAAGPADSSRILSAQVFRPLGGEGFAPRLAGSAAVLSRPVLDHSGIHCCDRATERPIQTHHSAIGFDDAQLFA